MLLPDVRDAVPVIVYVSVSGRVSDASIELSSRRVSVAPPEEVNVSIFSGCHTAAVLATIASQLATIVGMFIAEAARWSSRLSAAVISSVHLCLFFGYFRVDIKLHVAFANSSEDRLQRVIILPE